MSISGPLCTLCLQAYRTPLAPVWTTRQRSLGKCAARLRCNINVWGCKTALLHPNGAETGVSVDQHRLGVTLDLKILCPGAMGCMRKIGPLLYHYCVRNLGSMWPPSCIWLNPGNPDLGLGGGWPRQEKIWGRVLASLYIVLHFLSS